MGFYFWTFMVNYVGQWSVVINRIVLNNNNWYHCAIDYLKYKFKNKV